MSVIIIMLSISFFCIQLYTLLFSLTSVPSEFLPNLSINDVWHLKLLSLMHRQMLSCTSFFAEIPCYTINYALGDPKDVPSMEQIRLNLMKLLEKISKHFWGSVPLLVISIHFCEKSWVRLWCCDVIAVWDFWEILQFSVKENHVLMTAGFHNSDTFVLGNIFHNCNLIRRVCTSPFSNAWSMRNVCVNAGCHDAHRTPAGNIR